MRGLCQEFGAKQKVQIAFQSRDFPAPLPREVSLCFFRVLQEALHNSVKHSGARNFEVEFWGRRTKFISPSATAAPALTPEQPGEGRGLGLISMEERLKLLHGRLFDRVAAQEGHDHPRSRSCPLRR